MNITRHLRGKTKEKTFHIFFSIILFFFFGRIDTGDDNRVSKEEFCSDKIKESITKWVGEIEDFEAEFEKIDANGGGQVSTFFRKFRQNARISI